MKPYKQKWLLVMEDGRVVFWTGFADDVDHGEGLAIAYATAKYGTQVWDTCRRPVIRTGQSIGTY